ncbi:MAG: cyclic nucleotide-binding domain-containing protein [Ignavibacteriae bacterium]|nr:cyclic nucleotide-binding domain-containing protein [Ignavibacteriota bacterium]
MEKDDLSEIMRQHPFLAGLSFEHMQTLIGCASNVRFADGDTIIHEGQVANKFYLMRSGRVALQMDVPGKTALRIQTVGPGEILGWSWLISPFRWHFSGIVVLETRAIALDGECLRAKCEKDTSFGYEMLKRLSQVMERRLDATRLQLIDLYDTTGGVAR